MTRVEQLEAEITKLTTEERRQLERWFLEQQADDWDRQIEEDAKAGRLDAIVERVKRGVEAGDFTEL